MSSNANVIFTSIEEMPVDDWDGIDVEDLGPELNRKKEPVAGTYEHALKNNLLATASKPVTATYVPFVRTVKLGTIGKDVFAIKRALSKAGYGKWGQWGTRVEWFGPNRVKLLKNFQRDHHLEADGVYGLATHKVLAKYYDSLGIWLLHHTSIISTADQKRNLIVAAAMIGYMHRYNIHYTQSAMRMQGVRQRIKPPNYPIWEDCSSFATWCYWTSGASDPNGLGYNGEGYTGTLWNHGERVYSDVKKGDLYLYGWYGGIPTHVAVGVGGGRVVSHGGESGPLLLYGNYRGLTGIKRYI